MTDYTTPRFPLYIVSYDRYDNCLTADVLERLGVDYHIVVEKGQKDAYQDRYPDADVIVVPDKYHEEYETLDDRSSAKSQGPGPARNFAWAHAAENGHDWHWVMDDNIKDFIRYNDNRYLPHADGAGFRCMEDFVLQYENIAMAGPRYFMFISRKREMPPLTFNTRVYSCNLIRNDQPFRWRGRYNEDTDLSLRQLKNGWCTVLFNTFTQHKMPTQTVDGGNTENFYASEGTYNKSKMLKRMHPDVTSLTKKFGRWHHHVDYRPFKGNELVEDPDADVDVGDYNFREYEIDAE